MPLSPRKGKTLKDINSITRSSLLFLLPARLRKHIPKAHSQPAVGHLLADREECIPGKRSGKSLLAAHFLAANKGFDGDCNGTINILSSAVFRKTHFAKRFGKTHD
jgi:hypothetical protein